VAASDPIGAAIVDSSRGVITGSVMWRRFVGPTHEELADPFRAEVLLDDVIVAVITDRCEADDPVWASYAIHVFDDRVRDDELWMRGRFRIRDPASGRECSSAFVDVGASFTDGRIILRGLYFER
jgi:hypothetical protein